MATKGELEKPENKEDVQPIHLSKDFDDEKIRMRTAKATMTRAVKRLETALGEYSDLKGLQIDNKDFVAVAKEVSESFEDAKTAYKKMELINSRLEEKIVTLNRLGKVPDVDKTLGELGEALEQWLTLERR